MTKLTSVYFHLSFRPLNISERVYSESIMARSANFSLDTLGPFLVWQFIIPFVRNSPSIMFFHHVQI